MGPAIPLIAAAVPLLGKLFGGGPSDEEKRTARQREDLFRLFQPLLAQSVTQTQQRNAQLQPLFDAILRQVGAGLPSWAGLDLNMLSRPTVTPPPARTNWFEGVRQKYQGGG
jgi:hypothetical protein